MGGELAKFLSLISSRHKLTRQKLCQARVGSHLVDMGANWIHGTQNNPILDLVRATGTATHDWSEQQVAFGPDGVALPENVAAENAEVVWSLIGDAFKYSNESDASIEAGVSLMDYVKERIDEKVERMVGAGCKVEDYTVRCCQLVRADTRKRNDAS